MDWLTEAIPVYRLLHIAAAMAMIAGIAGRDLALHRAARAAQMPVVTALVSLAGRFEALLVRPGSMLILATGIVTMWAQGRPLVGPGSWWLTVSIALYLLSIPLIAFVFVPRGRRFEATLDSAAALGTPTPELAAAFDDRAVAAARRFEMVAIAVIVILMVTKPF